MATHKRKRTKNRLLAIVEYAGACVGLFLVRIIPAPVSRFLARRLGDVFYTLWIRRRRVARSNLATAFPDLSEGDARRIVRESCRAFLLTFLEMIQSDRIYGARDPEAEVARLVPGYREKAERMRRLHDETGGLIFVTAHLGNWEALLRVADVAEIPLVVVARPLDNPYLHKLVYSHRLGSKQEIVPKYNVMYALRMALRRGKCVAILGDQRAGRRGVMAPFFGRPASTHRTPALLAIQFNRPIVVIAACRTKTGFDGLIGEPIYPDPEAPEAEEILRLTTAMNEQLAEFIRQYPEQYLWVHNRWKHAPPATTASEVRDG